MDIKRIDIKEFRAKGYLQELNRRFLHPLGLALEVNINEEDGSEILGGVWDYRDDEEGMSYAKEMTHELSFKENAERVKKEMQEKKAVREKELGYFIQPVNDI